MTTVQKKRQILEQLAHDFGQLPQPRAFFLRNLRVHFAAIDSRRHHYLRRVYLRWAGAGEGEDYESFYEDYDGLDSSSSPIPDDMVNSTTFMALSQDELPTFPSEWALFHGDDFNLLNCIDGSEKVDDEIVDPENYEQVRAWLLQEMLEDMYYVMQGPKQPRLPFGGSERGPVAAITSHVNKERTNKRKYQESNPMASIDWEKAAEMAQERRALRDTSGSTKKTFHPDSFRITTDAQGDAFFKFRMNDSVRNERDGQVMGELAYSIEKYLAWADSYENLWDDDRRAVEDERTNYGHYLARMNEQLRDTLFSAYDDLQEEEEESFALLPWEDVPDLADYFEDMLFGFGRSPTSLEAYLHEHVFSKTPEEVENVALLERIREYMAVREEVGQDEDPYSLFFKAIWIKFSAILAEFHQNLTRHYLEYLESHPEEKVDRYNSFSKIDVFDMKDPKNLAVLSDYDEFQSRYVAQRKPFILSNVEMTKPFDYTLDFLVEKCGFVDVTKNIRESMSLGDKTVTGWGGLSKFELPDEIMTNKRRKEDRKGNMSWDKSVSLEQFIALTKHFDNIYLHDFGLKTKCSSLFWSETPYDPPSQQFFQIPSVIGRFDLFQKLPLSGFAHSWPSLFIGRKGSNSKLHIDSGATGFWMYLVSGIKRWIIYDEAERPYLYERIDQSSFMADVLALNATQNEEEQKMIHDYFDATHPLLSRANSQGGGYEIIQRPGDLIYIPPNSPHAVENLDDIVGVSFNQVPKSGITRHLFDMIHDQRDFGSFEIALRYLLSEPERGFAVVDSNPDDPLYTTFGEYLAQ